MFTQIFLLKNPKLRETPAQGGGKQVDTDLNSISRLMNCVILGKEPNLSEPVSPPLKVDGK